MPYRDPNQDKKKAQQENVWARHELSDGIMLLHHIAQHIEPAASKSIFIADARTSANPKNSSVQEVKEFVMPAEELKKAKAKTGLTSGAALEKTTSVYDALYAGEKKKESGALGVVYDENATLPKTPAEILKTGKPDKEARKADCDELTRAAYYLLREAGVSGLLMAEMTWKDKKTGKTEGHAVLILLPEDKDAFPLLFDFTYLYRKKPLEYENVGVSLKRKYAEEGKNPDFKIRYYNTMAEVEASHYDLTGWHYEKDKKHSEAIAAYEKAVSLVPDNFEYNRQLADMYKSTNAHGLALRFYVAASKTEEGKNKPSIYKSIASVYISLGNKDLGSTAFEDKAIESLLEAIKLEMGQQTKLSLHRTLSTAYTNKGIKLMNQGKNDDALVCMQAALTYYPQNDKADFLYEKLKK